MPVCLLLVYWQKSGVRPGIFAGTVFVNSLGIFLLRVDGEHGDEEGRGCHDDCDDGAGYYHYGIGCGDRKYTFVPLAIPRFRQPPRY